MVKLERKHLKITIRRSNSNVEPRRTERYTYNNTIKNRNSTMTNNRFVYTQGEKQDNYKHSLRIRH